MKFFMTICLFVLAICMVSGTPYGYRDHDFERHERHGERGVERHREGDISTSIQRVDNHNNNRHFGEGSRSSNIPRLPDASTSVHRLRETADRRNGYNDGRQGGYQSHGY